MTCSYPRVEINLKYLKENTELIVSMCEKHGVSVTGVIKGVTAIPECVETISKSGVKRIASSRIKQLAKLKDYGLPTELIRIPMLSEIGEVVKYADYSVNSELAVIEALNAEAVKLGKVHKVILMVDIGDLREGYWDKDELISVAYAIENDMENIELSGIGTNIGCYGSVMATAEKLQELCDAAFAIEKKINRKLEIVSGGATSSFIRIMDGKIPAKINDLRIGEALFLPVSLKNYYGFELADTHPWVMTLQAEIVEVKEKPSYPVGELGVDAFGHKPAYEDKGNRIKALVAVGKVDYGSVEEIVSLEEGVEILGASSDHTILDITDAKRKLKVGDIVEFKLNYGAMVFATNTDEVTITFAE